MAVDYKALNEEVNTLAKQMVAYKPNDVEAMKCRDAIANRLYTTCPPDKWFYNDFGDYVFYCTLLGKGAKVPVDVFTDTLFIKCLSVNKDGTWRFNPEKASFITFFQRKLRFAYIDYCGTHGYVDKDSLDEEGTDEPSVLDDFETRSDEFTYWCNIAQVVALQKKNEEHGQYTKTKKTYIESFFTVDLNRRARIGVPLNDKSKATDTDVFSADVCERDRKSNSFRPAMDDIMMTYMIVLPHKNMDDIVMDDVVYSALRSGIQEPMANRKLGYLLENAYKGHPKYQVTRQTAYKKRDAYDAWLFSITTEEHFWKGGYQL